MASYNAASLVEASERMFKQTVLTLGLMVTNTMKSFNIYIKKFFTQEEKKCNKNSFVETMKILAKTEK